MVGTTFSHEEALFKKPIFSIYEGNFLANKRNGKGIMKWKDGTSFEGEWLNDLWKFGKMVLEDGGIYEGGFNKLDQYNGKGTIKFEKFKFTGVFENHQPPKYGKLEVENSGDIYFGELQNFKKTGNGRMIFENGDIYEG